MPIQKVLISGSVAQTLGLGRARILASVLIRLNLSKILENKISAKVRNQYFSNQMVELEICSNKHTPQKFSGKNGKKKKVKYENFHSLC